MNWYKKSSLWDEIQKYGPFKRPIDIHDPSEKERIEFIKKQLGITDDEKIMKYLQPNYFMDFAHREYFTKNYGWSVPTKEAVDEIKKFVGNDDVLEIGSGYGMWAKLMQEAGIKIIPTDSVKDPTYFHYNPVQKSFADIENLSWNEALQKYSSHNVLMMSWPPYDSPVAYNALKDFKGNKLIFIGEGSGGCTANDDFFKELNKNWGYVQDVDIPQWYGIHDRLFLWVRK